MKSMLMFCLIKKWWDITWKEFKVNHIKLELMMFLKISLSCFDDKRYILDNGVNTLDYFHKGIRSKVDKIN